MNNKKIGTEFEQEFCGLLARSGYWVHFINPDRTGSQPFDIIAVKDGKAYAFDCKTCEAETFSISRLEDNQIMAFNKWWIKCGNTDPIIAIKHKGDVYYLWYSDLRVLESVKIKDMVKICGKDDLNGGKIVV